MKTPIFRIIGIFLAVVLSVYSWSYATVYEDVATEAENQILQIDEEEAIILTDLYRMEQEIMKLEADEVTISSDIKIYYNEIQTLEKRILEEENAFNENRDILKQILKTYQKRGVGTFVEILLDSDHLTDFLRRLNMLRDLTQDTGALLNHLEEVQQRLAIEKETLAEQLLNLEEDQKRLQKVVEEIKLTKTEKETYLTDLLDRRAFFENILNEISTAWKVLKPMFVQASEGFSRLAESGSLPEDAMKLRLSITGFDAIISEKVFNDAILKNPDIPELEFEFEEGYIRLSVPSKRLSVDGNFQVIEGTELVFIPVKGTFYDMPLDTKSMDELFEDGGLRLNLEPIIGNNKIKTAKSKENDLILSVQINLF
jgi:peptidoglycan hydrolase CwlO-like protein